MILMEVIQAAGGRVSGGDPYLWRCYGDHVQCMEFRDVAGSGYAHCIFNTNNYEVREIHVEVPGQDQAFRWIDPDYAQAYLDECEERNVSPNQAWDDVVYNDTDEKTIITFLKDVGEMYYDDLPIVDMA